MLLSIHCFAISKEQWVKNCEEKWEVKKTCAAIKERLRAKDWQQSYEKLSSITELDLSNKGISDISPLEGFTNISIIKLFNNQIVDISALSSLTNLTWVFLNRNFVSDLSPLADLDSLQVVNLRFNQITSVAPLANLKLSWLGLGFNKIEDFSPIEHLGLDCGQETQDISSAAAYRKKNNLKGQS